jgi:hypothetical protein
MKYKSCVTALRYILFLALSKYVTGDSGMRRNIYKEGKLIWRQVFANERWSWWIVYSNKGIARKGDKVCYADDLRWKLSFKNTVVDEDISSEPRMSFRAPDFCEGPRRKRDEYHAEIARTWRNFIRWPWAWLVKHQAMTYGEWRYSSIILYLDTRRWVVSFTPRGSIIRYPLCRRLDGSQIRSGRYEEDKNLLSLSGIEPRLPGRPARSLVAIPTVLYPILVPNKICRVTNWVRGASLTSVLNNTG